MWPALYALPPLWNMVVTGSVLLYAPLHTAATRGDDEELHERVNMIQSPIRQRLIIIAFHFTDTTDYSTTSG